MICLKLFKIWLHVIEYFWRFVQDIFEAADVHLPAEVKKLHINELVLFSSSAGHLYISVYICSSN